MSIRINTLIAKDGTEIMEISTADKTYRMNSLYRPIDEARRFASQFDKMKQNEVLLVFGYGNGIFPKAIMDVCGVKGKVIFYEPCSMIVEYNRKQYRDMGMPERNNIYYVSSGFFDKGNGFYPDVEFPELLDNIITYLNFNNVRYISLPQYRDIFTNEYADFEQQILNQIHRLKVNIATAKGVGHEAVVNNIMNLRYILDSYCADSFRDVFPDDVPAIIVSAGPSLEKNVHVLRDFKKHAVIICVDTAVGYLLKEGIVPDFVVSVDAVKPLSLFEDERILNIPIVVSSDVNYQVLEKLRSSRIIFASTENIYMQSLYKMSGHTIDKLKSGGSVANLAFSLSIYWGFHDVILVGQDLALSGEKMYAGDVLSPQNDGWKLIEVEDIYGNIVYTYEDYYAYLIWFEQNISIHSDVRVIDATEGGAKIRGCQLMTLEEACKKYSSNEVDVRKCLESVSAAFDSAEKRNIQKRINDSLSVLENLQDRLERGISLADLGVELTKQETSDIGKYKQIHEEMIEINEYYNTLDEAFYIQREIDATELEHFMSIFHVENNTSKTEQCAKIKEYFECLLRSVKVIAKEWSRMV